MTQFFMQKAREMFLSDHRDILHQVGVLPPSRNQNPLNPPLNSVEYEAMERDTSKYFLYYAAISMALQCLKSRSMKEFSAQHILVNCMVVGAGRGRFVDYCLDCFSELGISGTIYVIEANNMANLFLQEKFIQNKFVKVIDPIIIRSVPELQLAMNLNICDKSLSDLAVDKSIDLFISELFGSFGDNEFVSEILTACVNMFGSSNCISIPKSYTTYICAVHSPSLNSYFSSKAAGMYVLGLPEDAIMLSELVPVYSCKCTDQHEKLSSCVAMSLKQDTSVTSISGFAGYFRACLYNDIMIDTTPSDTQNTYFWETAFFTLQPEKLKGVIPKVDKIICNISRTCDNSSPSADSIGKSNRPLSKICYKWSLQNIISTCLPEFLNKDEVKVYSHTLFL